MGLQSKSPRARLRTRSQGAQVRPPAGGLRLAPEERPNVLACVRLLHDVRRGACVQWCAASRVLLSIGPGGVLGPPVVVGRRRIVANAFAIRILLDSSYYAARGTTWLHSWRCFSGPDASLRHARGPAGTCGTTARRTASPSSSRCRAPDRLRRSPGGARGLYQPLTQVEE